MLKDHEAAIGETLSALIEYLYYTDEEVKNVDYPDIEYAMEVIKKIYNEI